MTRRSGCMLPVAALTLPPKCPARIAACIDGSGIALLASAKSTRRSCACQPHEAAK